MSGWQPIETAPKDGTSVLIFGTKWRFDWAGDRDESFAAVCSWCEPMDDESGWSIDHSTYYTTDCLVPTHWMPLPEPPVQATEAGTAETGTGSVHEGAVGSADAPKPCQEQDG